MVKKTNNKAVVARGKRKEAIARASVKPGKGKYTYNDVALKALTDPIVVATLSEPLLFFDDAANFDIEVHVQGGGAAGQAQAARTAVAKALLEIHGANAKTKEDMLSHDRSLLVEDSRRVEPKKFKGPKARARFTKSYR